MNAVPEPRYIAGCVVSVRPTVVVAKRDAVLPLGLASLTPNRFQDAPSLHFIGQTSTWEDPRTIDNLARDIEKAMQGAPKARFVIMANTPFECTRLTEVGLTGVLGHELIFVDERTFTPMARERREKLYDAIYIARLNAYKRHELASAVENLLLAYGRPEPADAARVKQLLPNARFANQDAAGGAYKHLDANAVRDLMRQSTVGLCLSASEGGMRASMEYRYCGLPVVSTQALGGRDRYLLGPHVRMVEDDPEQVAAAVRDLKAQAFDPIAVREYAGRLVAVDRHSFLLSVNKIVEREFGIRDRFRSFAPFMHYPGGWRPTAQVLAPLDELRD